MEINDKNETEMIKLNSFYFNAIVQNYIQNQF